MWLKWGTIAAPRSFAAVSSGTSELLQDSTLATMTMMHEKVSSCTWVHGRHGLYRLRCSSSMSYQHVCICLKFFKGGPSLCGTCGIGPLLSKHSSRWSQDMPSPAMAVVVVASNPEQNVISQLNLWCFVFSIVLLWSLVTVYLQRVCGKNALLQILPFSAFNNSKCQQLYSLEEWSALLGQTGLVLQTLPHVSLTILPRNVGQPFLPSHFRPTLQIYAHNTFGRMRVAKLERLQVFSVSLAFFSSCRRQRSASSWKERSSR